MKRSGEGSLQKCVGKGNHTFETINVTDLGLTVIKTIPMVIKAIGMFTGTQECPEDDSVITNRERFVSGGEDEPSSPAL